MRVAIFIDSRYRDTIPCVLLKKRLQALRADWDILLVSIDLWQQTMELFRPHVVVLNHGIGFRNQQIINRAQYSVVLPTEGRPNTKEQETWYVDQQDGVVDLYLSWNDTIAQLFKKTKAITTGCPRFDVHYTHQHAIDSKSKARAKYGLPQDAVVIGAFTSFPQAKFSFQDTAFNKRDWKDLGVDTISTRTDPLAFAQKELRERQKFMTAIDALSDEHPDWAFLIKPHPMEDTLMIQQWCDQRGYTCVTQDTVFNVIAAVDTVVNRIGCITELDAMLQGIPVVSFGIAEDDGMANRPSCQSVSELLEYATTDQFFTPNPDTEYIELCGLDSPAIENVARAIVENAPKIQNSDVIPVKNIVMLQKAIFEHGWHGSNLDLTKGAVGKTAVVSYINTWEERL